jgi:signal transduction histidine kinase
VTVAIRAEADAIVLTVRDEGRGIPAVRRAEFFEPVSRLDDERGAAGAGRGRAIVREIAQAHGGSARAVEPESGAGAQFELRIPRENALMDRDPVNP